MGVELCPEPAGLGGCLEDEPGAGMPPDDDACVPQRRKSLPHQLPMAHFTAHLHGAGGAVGAAFGGCSSRRPDAARGWGKRAPDSREEGAPAKRMRPAEGLVGGGLQAHVVGGGCEPESEPAEFEPQGVNTIHRGSVQWGDECDEQPRGIDLCYREMRQPGWSFDSDCDDANSAPMGPGASFDGAIPGAWWGGAVDDGAAKGGMRGSVKRQAALSLQEFDLLEQLGGMNFGVSERDALRGNQGSGKRQKVFS